MRRVLRTLSIVFGVVLYSGSGQAPVRAERPDTSFATCTQAGYSSRDCRLGARHGLTGLEALCFRKCAAGLECSRWSRSDKRFKKCMRRVDRCVTKCKTLGCRQSPLCTSQGHCKYEATIDDCLVTVKSCGASDVCQRFGHCSANKPWSSCTPTKEGCKRSLECREDGMCGFDAQSEVEAHRRAKRGAFAKGDCVINASGCKRGKQCREDGDCGFDTAANKCAPTALGCKRSKMCRSEGLCAFEPDFGGSCVESR